MNVIPSVNLQDFVSGDPVRKQKFIDEIGKAYEEIGFVALKGHFLDDKLVDDLYGEVKNFFSLPVETKKNMKFPVLPANVVTYLLEKKVQKVRNKVI